MEIFEEIVQLLKVREIRFTIKEHEPTFTSEDSARIRGDTLSSGAKAILYKVQDEYGLFVFSADQRMDTSKIKTYFKSQGKKAKKTRFASVEELLELTGLVPGSVPPFGKPILNFDLYVDPSLLQNDQINFNAGSLQRSISMSLDDYLKVASPNVFSFIQSPE